MRLGLHLPQIGAPSPDEVLAVARRAENHGWSSLWVSDHLLLPARGGALPPLELDDPVTLLAGVATATRTIRLGTSVLVLPYRNPVALAKALATLDRLAGGGRLLVGVASGWLEEEFRALGAPWRERGAFTDEAIDLLRTLWSSPEPEFLGRFFSIEGMHFGPRPAAAIPILVGGTSRRAVRRAIERGDGWHGSRLSPPELAGRVAWLRDEAARAGRSLGRFAISHRVYVGFAQRWTETAGYVRGVLGPPAELAAYLARFAEAGAGELLVTPLAGDGGLEPFLDRFEREVVPSLPQTAVDSPG